VKQDDQGVKPIPKSREEKRPLSNRADSNQVAGIDRQGGIYFNHEKPRPTADLEKEFRATEKYAVPVPTTQSCPGGICAGGDINGSPTVNNFAPPDWHLTSEQIDGLKNIANNLPNAVHIEMQLDSNPNSRTYGIEVHNVFKSINPQTSDPAIVFAWSGNGESPEGILVFVRAYQDVAAKTGRDIQNALMGSSVPPIRFGIKPWLKDGEVEIVVGIRPK
jgi:hypothetical protein